MWRFSITPLLGHFGESQGVVSITWDVLFVSFSR